MSRIPFPEDEYLIKLGKAAYSVSYFEWSIIGDLLYIIANNKIDGIEITKEEVEKLFSMTSGSVAKFFIKKSEAVSNPDLKQWLRAAGDGLDNIVDKRNDIIHSHPITNKDKKQRLYRTKKHFEIDDNFLDIAISELSNLCTDVGKLRLLFNKIPMK